MVDLLDCLSDRRLAHRASKAAMPPRFSRHYSCGCGDKIYFENLLCPGCKAPLGYLADERRLASLEAGPTPDSWFADGRKGALRYCANHDTPIDCNWMLDAEGAERFCTSCRLTRTIPDLSDPDNVQYLMKIEAAKRRLVSQLLELGSPVRSKINEDPQGGVMFDFLRSPPGGPQVMTGHASGLITLNVEEADDPKREKVRCAMREPYRTLLGDFRHEIGHYYWDRLIWNTKWLEPFRQIFGDERASYAEALKRNYEQGPPADWADSFISSYATMHPWEDWAETWAHYMHITDSVNTAIGFGLDADDVEGDVALFGKDALHAPDDPRSDIFLDVINDWREITAVLNELARSMGEPDFYPFNLSKPAVAKLQFVQMVVSDARH
jgi:hypothetical protein